MNEQERDFVERLLLWAQHTNGCPYGSQEKDHCGFGKLKVEAESLLKETANAEQ